MTVLTVIGGGYLALIALVALVATFAAIRGRLRDTRTTPGIGRDEVWRDLAARRGRQEKAAARQRKRDQQEIDRLIESTKSK